MNNQNTLNWLAETVSGVRPSCAATVTIGDNGRHKSFSEYRLVLTYEDENGDRGRIEVTPEIWNKALKTAIGV